jgi:predicted DNA-binding ribbon-helix-helix protein
MGDGDKTPTLERPSLERMTRPLKRSFTIKGHRTSVSMEAPFWDALQHVAALEDSSLANLVAAIDAKRGAAGLSSAIRVWILDYFRQRAVSPPH